MAHVLLAAPVTVERTLVVTPDKMIALRGERIAPMKRPQGMPAPAMSGRKAYEIAGSVEPGHPLAFEVRIGIESETRPETQAGPVQEVSRQWHAPQWLAVIGGGIFVLLSVAALWLRPRRPDGTGSPPQARPGSA